MYGQVYHVSFINIFHLGIIIYPLAKYGPSRIKKEGSYSQNTVLVGNGERGRDNRVKVGFHHGGT